MSGVVLVGEAPPKRMRPALWLLPDKSGRRHSANRLLEATGWELERYLEVFTTRTNLLASSDGWSHPRARVAARSIVELAEEPRILVLGKRAARAFELDPPGAAALCDAPPFAWRRSGTVELAWMPHPSGRNRWWNQYGHREQAREFFVELDALAST